MAVLLIFVGTYLEFLRGGAALHTHVLGASFFLRNNGIDGEFAELELGVDAEEFLAAVNEGGVEGEGDIGGLEKLEDIVFLALVFELDFVLEVEGGLGVPVDVEVEEVAYLGIEAHLDVLVKIETGDTAAVGVEVVVVAEIVHNLEGEVCATGGVDADVGYGEKTIHLLADFAEAGYAAEESVVRGSVTHSGFLVPVLLHELVHLVTLVLLEGHVLAADDHIAQARHFDVRTALGIVFHRGFGSVGGLGVHRCRRCPQHHHQQQCHDSTGKV